MFKTKDVEIKKRRPTWTFILAFLLGAIFAEITADPISDLLFFYRASQTNPMTSIELVEYWYYIPAAMYTLLTIIALVMMLSRKFHAESFLYLLVLFSGISLIFSWKLLGFSTLIFFMLVIPLLLLVFVLNYSLKIGKVKV